MKNLPGRRRGRSRVATNEPPHVVPTLTLTLSWSYPNSFVLHQKCTDMLLSPGKRLRVLQELETFPSGERAVHSGPEFPEGTCCLELEQCCKGLFWWEHGDHGITTNNRSPFHLSQRCPFFDVEGIKHIRTAFLSRSS